MVWPHATTAEKDQNGMVFIWRLWETFKMYANQIASTWLNRCFGYWAKINPLHFDVNEIDANPSNGIRIEGKWEWRAHMKAYNPIEMVRWQVSVFKINTISLSILEQPIYHSTNGPLSVGSQNQPSTTNNGPPIIKCIEHSPWHVWATLLGQRQHSLSCHPMHGVRTPAMHGRTRMSMPMVSSIHIDWWRSSWRMPPLRIGRPKGM